MLGGIVVYRQYRGKTLLCNRPEKRNTITPHQQKMKSRFLEAVAFAKKMIADPATKALYQPGPESKFTSAYAAALADYLKRPVIDDVDVTGYHGNEGDMIIVKASDIARTLTVTMTVMGINGEVIEQGEALPNAFNLDYVFSGRKKNNLVHGSVLRVTVTDKPGNVVVREVVFD
jgi:hypothetical protein